MEMKKSPRRKRSVVLGLRATPEQKAWLTALAKGRGMTLQALFDDIMLGYAASGWLPEDQVTIALPRHAKDYGEMLALIMESGPKYKNLADAIGLILRGMTRQIHAAPTDGPASNEDIDGSETNEDTLGDHGKSHASA